MTLNTSDSYNHRYVAGVDIGGTFTDCVMYDSVSGKEVVSKVSTTLDPAEGFIEGVESLVDQSRVPLYEVSLLLHSTTLASNALIERKGAQTALITTRGFKDVLEIARELRYDPYDLELKLPTPLVPRFLRKEVDERILANGKILRRLDLNDVMKQIRGLSSIESFAVCLVHSYANPLHEHLVRAEIKKQFPSAHITLSSDLISFIGEYERTSSTVVNAYLQPLMHAYLSRLTSMLSKRGFRGRLFMMTSAGGLVTPDIARRYPVRLIESGPASGVVMAHYLSRNAKKPNAFSFDMGGTTAKGCLIDSGIIPRSYELEVARLPGFKKGSGIPTMLPSMHLIEIGGGGGSIARIDDRGLLIIGPQSAGAYPGPACYGRDGKEPTITDADLLLGYLDSDFFLGGKMKLYTDLAKRAIAEKIARPLGVTVEEAALGIYNKVNEDISKAFRIHAAERGIDYRNYAFIPFGGAGPVHACHIAKNLKIRKVMFPYRAGVLSTLGLLVAPISFETGATRISLLSETTSAGIVDTYRKLERRVDKLLVSAGIASERVNIKRMMDLRYRGQGNPLEILISRNDTKEKINMNFEERYREINMMALKDQPIEVVNYKVLAIGPESDLKFYRHLHSRGSSKPKPLGQRKVSFEGVWQKCPIYSRYQLDINQTFSGPALVVENESTAVIDPEAKVTVDEMLNLVVELSD